jgi:DNA-binding response OmpR family regulator
MPSSPRLPHILVVDAHRDIFELIAPGFREQRYCITHVKDVAAAKDVLGLGPVDVVLSR